MRPLLPITAAVLLAAGATALPAMTAQPHHTWKKANIDTAAMSSSMLAQNPNAFSPSTASTGAAAEAQPGAINSGMSNDTTAGTGAAPAGQAADTSMQPASGKDQAATTNAHHKTSKHKHKAKSTEERGESSTTMTPSSSTATPSTGSDQTPGAINSGTSPSQDEQGMKGNSATTGAASSPTANPNDSGMTSPDTGKTMASPSASSSSSSQ